MARNSCSLNLYQMVNVYQDLTIALVSSAKYFIMGNPKYRETCFATVVKQITQGLNVRQMHVVKFGNSLATPQAFRFTSWKEIKT